MLTGRAAAGPVAPEQVHLQFGTDAASQVAVSWAAQAAVARPRLRFAPAAGRTVGGVAGRLPGLAAGMAEGLAVGEVEAAERGYTDALTGETVYTYHARIGSLEPDTAYAYEVVHDGAPPVAGTFRTGPRGRSRRFTFTSFGDQSVPEPVGLGHGPHSPNAGYVVDAIESLDPLFHLVNGDLCYSNCTDQPVATWAAYFENISRSARFRPWMPAVGNHEIETGNGSHGHLPYQTRFELPGNGTSAFAGDWYAFRVGSVLVISLSNDDVCLQDAAFSSYRRDHVAGYDETGADPYTRGYSGGRQRAWLERTLAAGRACDDIDWIVVCMHQVAMSSAHFNGADLGIRRQWLPLFDAYGVDLVVAGHEHLFERTFPVRGALPGSLLTPMPRGSDIAELDPTRGTVHLTIGGGGHPYTTPSRRLHGPGEGVVIGAVGPGDRWRQRQPMYSAEPAPWSAYVDDSGGFGFAAFEVDPPDTAGTTSITVTYYRADPGSPDYRPADSFVLRKSLRSVEATYGELTRASRTMDG